MSTISQTADNRIYPDKVYDAVDADITLAAVEKIASTKPEWAEWDDMDFPLDFATDLTEFPGAIVVDWCRNLADDITMIQTAYYAMDGGKLGESVVSAQVWVFGDDHHQPTPATQRTPLTMLSAARELIVAGLEYARLTMTAAPILSEADPRWNELVDAIGELNRSEAWKDRDRVDIRDLNGTEKGTWHARNVLGIDDEQALRTVWDIENVCVDIRSLASNVTLSTSYNEEH